MTEQQSFVCRVSVNICLLSSFFPSSFILLPLSLTEGHDILMVSEEEDKVLIVAGTFERLVEQLACEERPGQHMREGG